MSSYTEDLLSDLKQSVAEDIAAEHARIEAERAARAAAEEDAARQAEAARRAEIDARLEAERQRRRLADESRRAIAAGDDPSVPSSVDDHPATARQPATVERLAALNTTPSPAQPQGHGAGFYFVVVGLPMLCLTAIAVAWILSTPPQPILAPVDAPLTRTAPTPPETVIDVARPGDGVDAPTTPVSANLGAEDEAEVEETEEKPTAEKKPVQTAAQRKAAAKRRAARAAEKARKEAEAKANKGGLKGKLFGGEDVGDMLDIVEK